jgi:hypothetical protein
MPEHKPLTPVNEPSAPSSPKEMSKGKMECILLHPFRQEKLLARDHIIHIIHIIHTIVCSLGHNYSIVV